MASRVRNELFRWGLGALVTAVFFQGGAAAESWPHSTYYTIVVRPGDTIGAIGARYHVSSARIAGLNRIENTGELQSGEVLRIPATTQATRQAVLTEALDNRLPNYAQPPRGPDSRSVVTRREAVSYRQISPTNRERPIRAASESIEPRARESTPRFGWPVDGSIISGFGRHGAGERNDGINIAAELGEPIHAAASGTVTYAGNLKDYGNLILIAHADGYTTAYAHADSISVERGDHVEKGQVIGTAGETGGVDRPQLHFEIRHFVKPVDPGLLLVASR